MKGPMKLVNPSTGEMVCPYCGYTHLANLAGGGKYRRGSWQCAYGCKREVVKTIAAV